MEAFGFSDAASWALIFGHLVGFRHVHWDLKYRGVEQQASLTTFASLLNQAAPCRNLVALRGRLQDHYGTMTKAWMSISGKDADEDVDVGQWRHGMQAVYISFEDATYLFLMLRAVPIVQRTVDSTKQLMRGAFFTGMKHAEAVGLLFDIIQKCAQNVGCGAVSHIFESTLYESKPLPMEDFAAELSKLVKVSNTEAKLIFAFLDVHQDGHVGLDDLLDALTSMQVGYFPMTQSDIRAIDKADDGRPFCRDEAQVEVGCTTSGASNLLPISASPLETSISPFCTITSLCRKLRPNTVATASVSPASPSSLLPSMAKTHSVGRSHAALCLQAASTAVPESDSDDSDGRNTPGESKRPWTSMALPMQVPRGQTSPAQAGIGMNRPSGFTSGRSSVQPPSTGHGRMAQSQGRVKRGSVAGGSTGKPVSFDPSRLPHIKIDQPAWSLNKPKEREMPKSGSGSTAAVTRGNPSPLSALFAEDPRLEMGVVTSKPSLGYSHLQSLAGTPSDAKKDMVKALMLMTSEVHTDKTWSQDHSATKRDSVASVVRAAAAAVEKRAKVNGPAVKLPSHGS